MDVLLPNFPQEGYEIGGDYNGNWRVRRSNFRLKKRRGAFETGDGFAESITLVEETMWGDVRR
jgi:hypothetical protein